MVLPNNPNQENQKKRSVFISSPFSEPKGQGWNIRFLLHDLLRNSSYKPWIYEIEGERERSITTKPPESIIREAIQSSDVIVCFFKQRLGSWMWTPSGSGPFHGTDDEISYARQLNKPVLLYRIGDAPQPLLLGFWELFEESWILPHAVIRVAEDKDLLSAVPRDLAKCWDTSSPLFYPSLNPHDATQLWCEIPDRLTLERVREALLFARSQDDLCSAQKIADSVPLTANSRFSRGVKLSYAALLADCGNTWANRNLFDRAISAVQLGIRYYLEAGDTENFFSQALCLSGILNMANLRRARNVHSYASRTIFHMQSFRHMRAPSHDAKASILMTAEDWNAAHMETERALAQSPDVSPYLLSKYAVSMAVSGRGLAKLGDGNSILFEQALPLARRTGRDLGYTLKWAAILALSQNERARARTFIDEGTNECIRIGNLHTLSDIRAAEAKYQLTAS